LRAQPQHQWRKTYCWPSCGLDRCVCGAVLSYIGCSGFGFGG
jgi:hypothetical protein